jgi:hypothetical protein
VTRTGVEGLVATSQDRLIEESVLEDRARSPYLGSPGGQPHLQQVGIPRQWVQRERELTLCSLTTAVEPIMGLGESVGGIPTHGNGAAD